MTQSLDDLVRQLELSLPELRLRRSENGLRNDLFEAVDDLLHLARHALQGDTQVNYPIRADEEIRLWNALTERMHKDSDDSQRQQGRPLLEITAQILQIVKNIQPPVDGHLGVLRIIHEDFDFLTADYGFNVTDQEPTRIRFSSGSVYIVLAWANQWDNSCIFGPESEPPNHFWIKDLLFMYGDQRYRTLPDELALNTQTAVENWFRFLAAVFKQYGYPVLTNQPGIFAKLAKAQAEWDLEYTKEMDQLYGGH